MSSTPRRPTRGMTYEMWAAYDAAPGALTLDHIDAMAVEHGWPKALARSHFKQWAAAGGKNAVPAPAPKPGKPKKEPKPVFKKRAAELGLPVAPAPTPPAPEPEAPKVEVHRHTGPLRICKRCGGEEARLSFRCAFCSSRDLREAEPGEVVPRPRMFLALAPHAWGLGMTHEDAGAALLKAWPKFLPQKNATCQLWDVPRSAYVDINGLIAYAKGDEAPVLILEVTI